MKLARSGWRSVAPALPHPCVIRPNTGLPGTLGYLKSGVRGPILADNDAPEVTLTARDRGRREKPRRG
jgi:hypothetical protein